MNDETQNLLKQFEPKELKAIELDRQVHAARFSPCGRFLFAGGYEGEVRRWDLSVPETPQLEPLVGHNGWVQPIAFHPHEKLLFTADSWGQLRAWMYDGDTPQLKWSVPNAHDGWIRDLAVSPDGQRLASCGRDRIVRVWSTADGAQQCELAGHEHDVYSVRFHPQGDALVSGDERGQIKQWDWATGVCSRQFDAGVLYLSHRLQDVGGVRVLAFDAEGKTLAVGGTTPEGGGTVQGKPTVLLFEFESGQLRHTLTLGQPNDCYVHDVHLHPAGFVIAVTSGTPGAGQLLLQRPEDAEPFFRSTKMANCQALSIHPDTRRLAVTATNRGSNGNGRVLTNDGEYAGNNSPIHLFEIPPAMDTG